LATLFLFHGKTEGPGMGRQTGTREERADQDRFFHHALQEIEGDVAGLEIGENQKVGIRFVRSVFAS
jgi:hypothetical protein